MTGKAPNFIVNSGKAAKISEALSYVSAGAHQWDEDIPELPSLTDARFKGGTKRLVQTLLTQALFQAAVNGGRQLIDETPVDQTIYQVRFSIDLNSLSQLNQVGGGVEPDTKTAAL